jgi:DNA topoisomerase IB
MDESSEDEPIVSRKKTSSRASAQAARSKMAEDGDDDDDDEEFEFNDESSPPKKKAAKPPKSKKIKDEGTDAKKPYRASAKAARVKMEVDDDKDDEEEEDDDFEEVSSPPKKKAAAKKTKPKKVEPKKRKRPKDEEAAASSPKKKSVPDSAKSSTATAKLPKLKALDKTERLQYAMQSFLWWDAPEPPKGCQWVSMEHAGVSFPEPYQPHHVPLYYNGEPVTLTSAQEEAATFFAATDPDGMHLGNPTTAKIFIDNFFQDFLSMLGKKHVIREFAKCDFGPMRRHLAEQKMIKKAVTDAERRAAKDDRSTVLHQFGYAIVDGHLERVGNYNMEPPGAFRGRGAHPKMGQLKHRVRPEQVSLNLSEHAPVPRCPVPGHAWSDVRHDPKGQWLATWKENINNQVRMESGFCILLALGRMRLPVVSHIVYFYSPSICNWQPNRHSRASRIDPNTTRRLSCARTLSRFARLTRRI